MPTGGLDPHEQAILDRDRLPWLETVEQNENAGTPVARIGLLVIVALALVAAVILAYQWSQQRQGIDGHGALIAAQEGDYKVRPDDPGGLKVQGEGSAAIATSNGSGTGNALIDVNAAPEAPVAGKKARTDTTAKGANVVIAALPDAIPKGGSLVQLGSFPDEGGANAAWTTMTKRLTWLGPLGKSVQAAQVNGQTMYRLRVNAGSTGQASALCARLKAAGQACLCRSPDIWYDDSILINGCDEARHIRPVRA